MPNNPFVVRKLKCKRGWGGSMKERGGVDGIIEGRGGGATVVNRGLNNRDADLRLEI